MKESEAIKKHIDECNHRIENISFFIDSNSDANKEECCNNIEILQKVINALEKQIPKKPILKNGEGGAFVDYADGHGEYKVTKWQDWVCPVCGLFVGQRYNAHRNGSKPHPHD